MDKQERIQQIAFIGIAVFSLIAFTIVILQAIPPKSTSKQILPEDTTPAMESPQEEILETNPRTEGTAEELLLDGMGVEQSTATQIENEDELESFDDAFVDMDSDAEAFLAE